MSWYFFKNAFKMFFKMLKFFTRSTLCSGWLKVILQQVQWSISSAELYLFILFPFPLPLGRKAQKGEGCANQSEGFLHSSPSVGKRRIHVSHLPIWLISGGLNISNNFWGWEICGFLWVLGESCLNQWQRQLQLLSGLASGAKLCNFYSKFVAV